VLGILSGNWGIFPIAQVAATLEQSLGSTRVLLQEMSEQGWVERTGIDQFILTSAGREAAGRKWREGLWDLLDTAMEEAGGHQGNAAPLLGISRHTMHKYLAASIGRVNLSTIQAGQHYYGPEFLAPPNHPIRRWRQEEYLAGLRNQRRVEQFGDHWVRIDGAMEQSVGVINEAARLLGISEGAVRKHIRIAAGLGQEPLARWGDSDYIQARQDELRRSNWEQIRQERTNYLQQESPYRKIPTHQLAAGEPESVPESIRLELVTRYSVGDEQAGQELVRLYDAWIVKESHARRVEEIPMEDMIQAGRMGVLQAAFSHDPGQGAKFLTYANYFILKEQVRLIRDHMGTYITGEDRDLMRAMHALQNRAAVQGESLTLDALAAQLQVTSDRLEQIRLAEQAEQPWRLDHESTEEGRAPYEVIAGEGPAGDRQHLRNTFINGVREFFGRYRKQSDTVIPPELLIDEFVDETALAERFAVRLDQVQEQRAELIRDLRDHLRAQGIEEDYFE
jgi:DNA-directed RNA polymerase specialized sigma subunit/DNA-binding protein Fis